MANKRERYKREQARAEKQKFSQREIEAGSGVSLEFFGWGHHPLDLQVIPQLRADLQESVTRSKGPVVIYIENADGSVENRNKAKQVASQVGYQGSIIFPMMYMEYHGRIPSVREIEERKRKIAESDIAGIIGNQLLPPGEISIYFISGVMDEVISKNRRARVEYETHGDFIKRSIESAETKRHGITRQLKWGSRDLDTTLDMYLEAQELYIEMERLRKPDLVNDLTSRARSLRPHGGTLFLVFGYSHEDLLEDVQKAADPGSRFISTNTRMYKPSIDHDTQVITAMKKDERPSDEMLAKAFFAIECFRALDELFMHGGGNLQSYADNVQTIYASVQDVASDLSFNDIRRLNDTGESVLKVFFAHPAARVVLPYLH